MPLLRAFDRRLALRDRPRGSKVRRGGGAIFAPTPANGSWLETPAPRGLTRLYSHQLTTQNVFMNFDSNRLTTQQASRILIQINPRLKKLFQNLDSNQLVTQ